MASLRGKLVPSEDDVACVGDDGDTQTETHRDRDRGRDSHGDNGGETERRTSTTHKAQMGRKFRRRWGMLAILCGINLSTGMINATYAPVATVMKEYYDVSITAINWLSQIFMLASIPITFGAIWTLDAKGLRQSVMFGGALNAVGAVVRCISAAFTSPHTAFVFVFMGQFLCACAQPFTMAASTKLAAHWFDHDQRALANTLASVAIPVGLAAGNVVTTIFASADNPSGINTAQYVDAVIAVVVGVFAVFIRSYPPSSISVTHVMEGDTREFIHGLQACLKNIHFWCLVGSFGLGVGVFNAYMTVFEQMIEPYGYTTDTAGLASAALIGCGLVGAALAAIVLDRTFAYKSVLCVAFTCASGCFLWFAFALQTRDNEAQLIANQAVLGFFVFMILSTSLELGAECTYPVAEGTSSGLLYMIGQGMAIIFIAIMEGPLTTGPERDMLKAVWFCFALILVATVFAYSFRGKYLRLANAKAMWAQEKSNVATPSQSLDGGIGEAPFRAPWADEQQNAIDGIKER